MRAAVVLALVSGALHAQSQMPVGFTHGGFVTASDSELRLRGAADAIYACSYDSRTYVERAHVRIAMSDLARGEPIEVLADRRAGSEACYTRMVSVVTGHPLPNLDPRLNGPMETLPRGTLTFAGTVMRVDGYQLSIRTRAGEVALRVRKDTRFVNDGAAVARGALPVNAHVFIRAERDIWGEIEAFQVMWGEIVATRW